MRDRRSSFPDIKRLLGALAIAIVLAVIAALGWVSYLRATGNFHEVLAGEIYRSAQPSEADLRQWAASAGLRSVLNLRGASDAQWYRDEISTSADLGLTHADFAMSDRKILPSDRARELIALIDSLPKPLLIHCAAGSDRSGLAAALALAANGASEAQAEAQISFYYGHVSLPLSAAWPMDQSWEALEPGLGYGKAKLASR